MSNASRLPSDHGQSLAPTLTEVVEAWESGHMPLDDQHAKATLVTDTFQGRWDASIGAAVATQDVAVGTNLPAPAPAPAPLNEDQIVQRVLVDLQRQIDSMLEYRVREALLPALTRATDALVLEARNELALTLRSIVIKSVAQELARHRKL